MRIAQLKVSGNISASSNYDEPDESEYEIVKKVVETDDLSIMSLKKDLCIEILTNLDDESYCHDESAVAPYVALTKMLNAFQKKVVAFADPANGDRLILNGAVTVSYQIYQDVLDENKLYSDLNNRFEIDAVSDLEDLIKFVGAYIPKFKQQNMFFFGDFGTPCFVPQFTSPAEIEVGLGTVSLLKPEKLSL